MELLPTKKGEESKKLSREVRIYIRKASAKKKADEARESNLLCQQQLRAKIQKRQFYRHNGENKGDEWKNHVERFNEVLEELQHLVHAPMYPVHLPLALSEVPLRQMWSSKSERAYPGLERRRIQLMGLRQEPDLLIDWEAWTAMQSKLMDSFSRIHCRQSLTVEALRKTAQQFAFVVTDLKRLQRLPTNYDQPPRRKNWGEEEQRTQVAQEEPATLATGIEPEQVIKQSAVHAMLPTFKCLSAIPVQVQQAKRDILLDSGAQVMSADGAKTTLRDCKKLTRDTFISGIHGDLQPVLEEGTWDLSTQQPNTELSFNNTLNLPGSSYDLISVGMLDDAGLETKFSNGKGTVSTLDGEILLVAPKVDGLYRLSSTVEQCSQHVHNWDVDSLLSAHEVMKHGCMDSIRKLLNFPAASRTSPNPVCGSCQYAKMREKKSGKEALTAAPRYGYRLHSDVSRKMPATNAYGCTDIQRYQLTGDEFTGSLWVQFCQRKSNAKEEVLKVIDLINNERTPERVVEHQTDGGKEYLNKSLNKSLEKRDITPRNSAPHCQYQNGWIERRMGELHRGSRAMMYRGNAPETDYPYALRHVLGVPE